MAPILRVLRGCFAAYLFAVSITAAESFLVLNQGIESVFGAALFWLVIAVPFTFVAFMFAIFLSARSARIMAWQAVAIIALTFLLITQLVGISNGPGWNVVVALGLGALCGAAFWIGAFGLARDVDFGSEGA